VTRGDTATLMSVPGAGGMVTPIVSLARAKSIRLSNDGKRIAVTRGSWSRNQLGVALRDGSLFRPHTDSSGAWYNLAWSPNDAGIAAARADSSGTMTLWLVRSESGRRSELVRMPKGYGRPQWPAWSPDGETILFQASVASDASPDLRDVHIHKLDVKSRKILRLRAHERPLLDEAPCWLDEDNIVFQSDQSGAFELWVMRADGTLAKQLTR
jgi:Tol biopolymer transport system component